MPCSTFAENILGRCRDMAKLSNCELDIMSCFWEQKQLSAPEVHKLLGVARGVTYSTIKSLIDRLEAKGALTRAETPGRVIYYRAAIKQDKIRKPLVKSFLRRLYGDDLSVNALRATLARGKPHEQAVAIGVLGEVKDRTAVADLVPMLAHDYPLVRYYAQRALQHITSDPVAIDVGAPAADVKRAAEAWLTRAAARP